MPGARYSCFKAYPPTFGFGVWELAGVLPPAVVMMVAIEREREREKDFVKKCPGQAGDRI